MGRIKIGKYICKSCNKNIEEVSKCLGASQLWVAEGRGDCTSFNRGYYCGKTKWQGLVQKHDQWVQPVSGLAPA